MPFTDNFTEATDTNLESHTPSGGTAWTRVDGVAGAAVVRAASDDLRSASSTNTLYTCDNQGSANQYVKFKIIDLSEGGSFVVCRATNNQNFIGVRVLSGKVRVERRVGGTLAQLGSTGATSAAAFNTVELRCDGDQISAYLNDNLEVGPVTETNHQSVTGQGIVARVAAGGAARWIDDFEAGVLGAPPATTKFWSVQTSAVNGTVRELVVMSDDRTTVIDKVEATVVSGFFRAECSNQTQVVGSKRFVFVHNWDGSMITSSIRSGHGIAEVIEV